MATEEARKKKGLARRGFLAGAGAMAAGVGVMKPLFTIAAESSKGANDRPGVGFIGTGGRCRHHIDVVNALKTQGKAEPLAVCDVYGPAVRAASKRAGGAKIYRKHKDLLADPDVDVVCIATPDRHHAPQAIDAVRAGKDVYVEKPLTHWTQFHLAKQLAEETGKHKRIVQVGTQYMAGKAHAQAAGLIKKGLIGKVVHVQAGFFRRGDWGERMRIHDRNAKPGPELDWEGFLGDAPRVPFTVSRFFQWRLYWDYAGGPSTDLLVHTFTPICAILGLGFPERVLGGGGKFQYDGLREVPDQCNMIIDYPKGPSVVLLSSLSNATGVRFPNPGPDGVNCNTIIRGTNGIVTFERQGIVVLPHRAKKPSHTIPWGGMGNAGLLWTNLLECVKTRKKPLSPVDVGARVQAPLNMAILSYRENKVARFHPKKQEIVL